MARAYGFSKFKRRSVQRLPHLVAFLSAAIRIKSSTRSCMHIYTHIPQRIMCPRVIYRAGTRTHIYLVTFPPCFSPSDSTSAKSIFAIHSFLEGRTRFSSFDGNPVVSDQRQLGTYPLLSALVCSPVDAFTALPRSQMSLPSYPPVRPDLRKSCHGANRLATSQKLRAEMESDTDIHYLEENVI